MNDVLDALESTSILEDVNKLKEDSIYISIFMGDDKVAGFRLYKNSKVFRRIDEAVNIYLSSKDKEVDYDKHMQLIVATLEAKLKLEGFDLMYMPSENTEEVLDDVVISTLDNLLK